MTPLQLVHQVVTDKFGRLPPLPPRRTYFSLGFDYPNRKYDGLPVLYYDAGVSWEPKEGLLVLSVCLAQPTLLSWKGIGEYFRELNKNIEPYLLRHVPDTGLRAELSPYWLGSGENRQLVPAYCGYIDCSKVEGEALQELFLSHFGCAPLALFLSRTIFEKIEAGEPPSPEERQHLLQVEHAKLSFLEGAADEAEDAATEEGDEEDAPQETAFRRPN